MELPIQGIQMNDIKNKIVQFNQIENIDPNLYRINKGDIFLAKIDIEGPDYNLINIPVSSEGYAVLPQGNSVFVLGLNLKQASEIIKNALKSVYKNSEIEVFFQSPGFVNVSVEIGSKKRVGLRLPASMTVANVAMLFKPDTSSALDSLMSKRFVILTRDGKNKKIDLFRAIFLKESEDQVYLKNNDHLIIPMVLDSANMIYISGGVNKPGYYEYNEGDNLRNLILFAGGLLETADTAKIDIFRRNANSKLEKIQLKLDEADKFILQRGDQVSVRFVPNTKEISKVIVRGEVLYPGEYGIIENETKLSDVIKEAGGFKTTASLIQAMVFRPKFQVKDNDFKRLMNEIPRDMDRIDRSYFEIKSRQNFIRVNCDFVEIFKHNNSKKDILLQSGDIIYIPKKRNFVTVTGGVFEPGILNYHPDWNVHDYLNAAGGLLKNAMKRNIKIIRASKGIWINADDDIEILPGDIIFIPVKKDRDLWKFTRETFTLITQIGTLLVVIMNLRKL
jgi:protein involved in polysaccharide export with SLBB domain